MPPLSLFRRRVRGDFSHEIGPRSGSLLCKTPISCVFRKNELVVFDKSDNDRIKYFVKKLNERRENFVAASKKTFDVSLCQPSVNMMKKQQEQLYHRLYRKKTNLVNVAAGRTFGTADRPASIVFPALWDRIRRLCRLSKWKDGRFIPEHPGKARTFARTLPDFSPPACHGARSSLP